MPNSNPSRKFLLATSLLAPLALATGVHAAAVVNGGFEALTGSDASHFSSGALLDGHASASANPLLSPLIYVTPDPAPGWTVDTQAGGTMNPTAAYMPGEALGGNYVGWSSGALLYQVLDNPIQPDTHYELTVNIGRPTVSDNDFAYRIIFESQGLVKIQDENSTPIAVGEWKPITISWDSPSVIPAGAKLTVNLAADKGVALFDDISLTDTPAGGPLFPEPASASLAFLGLTGTLLRRRR